VTASFHCLVKISPIQRVNVENHKQKTKPDIKVKFGGNLEDICKDEGCPTHLEVHGCASLLLLRPRRPRESLNN
jgi:hypothetical protein